MTRINFEIKSLNKETLLHYKNFLIKLFNINNIKTSCFFLPKSIKKITLLKSTHVYKKARDQFELRQYKLILIAHLNDFKILRYLMLNKPKLIKFKLKINRKIV